MFFFGVWTHGKFRGWEGPYFNSLLGCIPLVLWFSMCIFYIFFLFPIFFSPIYLTFLFVLFLFINVIYVDYGVKERKGQQSLNVFKWDKKDNKQKCL